MTTTFLPAEVEALRLYTEEIGVQSITLRELIDSHRTQRQTISSLNHGYNGLRDSLSEEYKELLRSEISSAYISISLLREMTIGEISDLLSR